MVDRQPGLIVALDRFDQLGICLKVLVPPSLASKDCRAAKPLAFGRQDALEEFEHAALPCKRDDGAVTARTVPASRYPSRLPFLVLIAPLRARVGGQDGVPAQKTPRASAG